LSYASKGLETAPETILRGLYAAENPRAP